MTLALDIQNLHKSYEGFQAVKNLNLQINKGEIFGLLGPNGAGKSSTIHLISGLVRLQSGSIKVFGKDVENDFVETRRRVGLMHQEIMIDNFLPIGKLIDLHPGYYGVELDKDWRNLLVDRLALGPHLHKKMMGLSGGMKRRLMVAKALIHKPELLILDEPTAGVDVELRVALWNFVREINREGTTVLLTTHYIEEAEELCGRIGIMNHGELIALDETKNLIGQINQRHLHLEFERAVKAEEVGALELGLKSAGAHISQKSDKEVEILLERDDSVNDLLQGLSKLGNPIVDFDLKKGDLEDAFISLTSSKSDASSESTGGHP